VLTPEQAVDQAEQLLNWQTTERFKLDGIRAYWRGKQKLPAVIPNSAPYEVRELARLSRVNICELVVNSLGQSMFMDGFRTRETRSNLDVWQVWQRNRFDRRQGGVYRSAFAYGSSYVVVTPGDTAPVMRGVSPRSMTTLYGEDPDWPIWALERWDRDTFRLYDDEAVYFIGSQGEPGTSERKFVHIETREHGMRVFGEPVCPVVRYLDEEDLDRDDEIDDSHVAGQIAPLIPLQDQIDITTFGLLVSQHYTAFKQRYILGWVPQQEMDRIKMSASQTWTFKDHPDDITIGELSETDLKGYLDSREASLRHAASISQTPAHELIGELVNLSAEALAAAEAGRDRKVDERKTLFGESNEQVLQLAGSSIGVEVPDDAQAIWRDTSAKSFSQLVDALGKAVQMLGIPPQVLWERLPDTTLQDVEEWKAEAQASDVFARLNANLERQAAEMPDEAA
jgi:hypothetical protein